MSETVYAMQVQSSKGNESLGSCQFENYTSKDALYIGVKMTLVTLLLTIFSIALPGIHFVSVPLGILALPFVGIYYYRTRKGTPKSMAGNFVCSACHATNNVYAPRITPYYIIKCVQCHDEIRLIPLKVSCE